MPTKSDKRKSPVVKQVREREAKRKKKEAYLPDISVMELPELTKHTARKLVEGRTMAESDHVMECILRMIDLNVEKRLTTFMRNIRFVPMEKGVDDEPYANDSDEIERTNYIYKRMSPKLNSLQKFILFTIYDVMDYDGVEEKFGEILPDTDLHKLWKMDVDDVDEIFFQLEGDGFPLSDQNLQMVCIADFEQVIRAEFNDLHIAEALDCMNVPKGTDMTPGMRTIALLAWGATMATWGSGVKARAQQNVFAKTWFGITYESQVSRAFDMTEKAWNTFTARWKTLGVSADKVKQLDRQMTLDEMEDFLTNYIGPADFQKLAMKKDMKEWRKVARL